MRQAAIAFPTGEIHKTLFAFLLAALLVAAWMAPAEANSKYASIVIDANTGKVLHESHADAPRYPASLTKMMTLYMVFEALSSGRITKKTRVPFSKYASSRPPTKLGVRPGGSINIETAILSLVTKSANDAAAAVGELLGGTEANFARMMTAKARSLGMNSTTFRNASGLPDPNQKTTARDMAVLGIALREHFPGYYDYFSTRSFRYGKTNLRNHNKLLGRVKGVDGIKTGYTRASGFNLVSSVKTGGRSIVAVVLGGRTGRSRDSHMAELIREYLPKASKHDGGPLIAARTIKPNGLAAAIASLLPRKNVPTPDFRPEPEDLAASAEQVIASYAPAPKPAAPIPAAPVEEAAAEPVVAEGDASPDPARFMRAQEESFDPVNTGSTDIRGWVIQVASMPTESEAREFLEKASKEAPTLLADANAFTQTFDKNGMTYYRARFAGFSSKDQAWNTCDALKRKKIACYAVQQ